MRTYAQKHQQSQPGKSGDPAGPSAAARSHKVPPILHVQRMIGNQPDGLEAVSDAAAPGRFGHDFSRISVHAGAAARVQPKLTVNTPGDIYEQEADRVSDQVMRMPDPHAHRETPGHAPVERPDLDGAAGGGLIQRSASGRRLDEDERLQAEAQPSRPDEDERLQAEAQPGATPAVSAETASGIQSLRGRGHSLQERSRSFFEPRFGFDLREVKIHHDSEAGRLANDVRARAFTIGRDVVFGAGQYRPDTADGMRLIAHELTHVVQQSGTSSAPRGSVAETISRTPHESISRVCHEPAFPPGAKAGTNWYSHDFIGAIPAGSVRAVPTNAGYKVPASTDASYNCMGWALSELGSPKSWQEGVSRDRTHPWPEEELLASKGCSKSTPSATADHKVRLYEYIDQDQFHIVRQECDGLWSGKTGKGYLWRGVTSPDDHTTSFYGQKLSNLRITDWSCG
jgi:hypothetical protein